MDLRAPVLASDVALRALCGVVEDRGDYLVVRTPDNPGYYSGNFVALANAPSAESLPRWLQTARDAFADDDRVGHVTLVWDDGLLSEDAANVARSSGGECAKELDMRITRVQPFRSTASVRKLGLADFEAIEELNRSSDSTEGPDNPEYCTFKEQIRAEWKSWMQSGDAQWFGAFRDDVPVGQCGLVRHGDVARFQAVETHPDHQRTGVATTLIGTVATLALEAGARAAYLVADPTGPAQGLYQRLGFESLGVRESWTWGGQPVIVRPERPGDYSDVRAIHVAAFGRAGEAQLVETLRSEPNAVSLVAVRASLVLGHILFTPAQIAGQPVMALGPMAVKLDHQREGIGSRLVREGLSALADCRACIVLGHPGFYSRFGFEPGRPRGITCKWPVPDDVFMVRALSEGGLDQLQGPAVYHPGFDNVD